MCVEEYWERVRKAKEIKLNYIKENSDLKTSEIAKNLGIAFSTARRYRIELEESGEIPKRISFIETVTDDMYDQLEQLYVKGYLIKEICDEMNITKNQFDIMINKMRYGMGKTYLRRHFDRIEAIDEADIQYVIDFYDERTALELSDDLGLPYKTVNQLIALLNTQGKIKKRNFKTKKLNDEHRQYILDNFGKMPTSEIARKLDVSNATVYYHASKFKDEGLLKDASMKKKYYLNDTQIQYIKDSYGKTSVQNIADDIGIPKTAVYNRIYSMIRNGELKKIDYQKEGLKNDGWV